MSLLTAVSFDFFSGPAFWIGVGILAGVYGIFTLGLQLNVGFTGILNFGQVGFMAIGAYAAVIFTVTVGLPFLLALPLSMLVTIIAGLIVGLPSLRLRADYLAIATIAFSEVIRISIQNSNSLTGGNQGTISLELDEGRRFSDTWFDWSQWISENIFDPIGLTGTEYVNLPLLAVVWIFLLALAFGLSRLVRSPWGRVLRAVREDEDAARALGKNAFSYKLQSLTIAAAIGSIAGWFYALQLDSLTASSFEPIFTFIGYVILILGGLASFGGVILGTVVFWTVLEGLREVLKELDIGLDDGQIAAVRFFVVGLVLILLVALRPQGALGKKEEMVLSD